MSIHEQAQAAVAAADAAQVAALLAAYPAADDLIPRDNWLSLTSSEVSKLPKELEQREARLQALAEKYAETVQKDKQAYERYRASGLAALSDYDIVIASSGDALAALRMAMRLLSAHVSYSLSFLMRFQLLLDEARAEREHTASSQLDLFA